MTSGLVASFLAVAVSQSERLEEQRCGQYCLEAVATALAGPEKAATVEPALRAYRPPFSLQELTDAARAIGLQAEACVVTSPASTAFDSPAILYLPQRSSGDGHFVACLGETNGQAVIVNFPFKSTLMNKADLTEKLGWRGETIVIDSEWRGLLQRVYWQSRLHAVGPWVAGGFAALAFIFSLKNRVKPKTAPQPC